jgi:DNA-binding transcriptional LysR family regulator
MDIRQLDLNLLRILDAMFHEQNVSAAARRLKLSQPAVSSGLNRLRAFFDDVLFVRTASGMRPTSFAATLAGPVREMFAILGNDLLRVPQFDPGATTRCFTLSTSDIGELVFLPNLLRVLRAQAPRASVRCVVVPHAGMERALEDGDVDIALGYFPDLQGANIYHQDLFDHPFTCLVNAAHPRIGQQISLKQFLEADHLVVNHEGRSQEIFERLMEKQSLERRIALHLPHFMSAPQLVADSDMISIVPLALGVWFARMGNVRTVAPPIEIPRIPLKQFWHKRVHNDVALSWLRGLITNTFFERDPYP